MQIRFLATPTSPDSYSFDGEIISVTHGNETEHFDLSELEEGGKFDSNFTVDTVELNNSQIIRDAERVNGELLVKLCQSPPVTKVSLQFEELGKYIYTVTASDFYKDPLDVGDSFNTGKHPESLTISRIIEHRGGDWEESDWLDATTYDDETLYIKKK